MKNILRTLVISFIFCVLTSASFAETCTTASEMDAGLRTTLQNTATQDFGYIASANTAQVAANSIQDIANNTAGLTGLLNEHKDKLTGATASARNVYFFDASGPAPIERA